MAGGAAGQGSQGRRSDHKAQPGTEAGATKRLDGPEPAQTGHTMEAEGLPAFARSRRAAFPRPPTPLFRRQPLRRCLVACFAVDELPRDLLNKTLQAHSDVHRIKTTK